MFPICCSEDTQIAGNAGAWSNDTDAWGFLSVEVACSKAVMNARGTTLLNTLARDAIDALNRCFSAADADDLHTVPCPSDLRGLARRHKRWRSPTVHYLASDAIGSVLCPVVHSDALHAPQLYLPLYRTLFAALAFARPNLTESEIALSSADM